MRTALMNKIFWEVFPQAQHTESFIQRKKKLYLKILTDPDNWIRVFYVLPFCYHDRFRDEEVMESNRHWYERSTENTGDGMAYPQLQRIPQY